MAIELLGISGSPIRDSNTERAVKAVCEHAGMPWELIRLSELDMEPCRACLGCVNSNRCVIADDGQALAMRFREAKAFVLGGFTPYSSLDARTKAFMERMYCLRHQTGLNRGKVGCAVITTACDPGVPGLPPAAQTAANQIAFWMMEEGMVNVGTLVVQGNVPCIKCGHGDDCPMSGVKMLHGAEATVASVGVRRFQDDVASQSLAAQLGQKIRESLAAV